MNNPGVWILGEANDRVRNGGMGIVVEYAGQAKNRGGRRRQVRRGLHFFWEQKRRLLNLRAASYLSFPQEIRGQPLGRPLDYKWPILSKTDPIRVTANSRYRLRFDNQSDEAHPVHLHRHTFELTKFDGKTTSGVMKDVVVVPARKQVEVDFTADNPGPTLFHCHQQLHMDYGFMAMLQYRG